LAPQFYRFGFRRASFAFTGARFVTKSENMRHAAIGYAMKAGPPKKEGATLSDRAPKFFLDPS
jgi:hypothetical protein